MNLVDKILFDPITKGLKMFSRGGSQVFDSKQNSEIFLQVGNGTGSTNTKVRRYTDIVVNSGGADLTLAQSSTLGDSITVNTTGVYAISVADTATTPNDATIAINQTVVTSGVSALIAMRFGVNSSQISCATAIAKIVAGSVVRWTVDNNATLSTAGGVSFRITRIS